MRCISVIVAVLTLTVGALSAQKTAAPASGFAPVSAGEIQKVPYGDFEHWLTRIIKESVIVGGEEREVYAIADEGVVKGKVPYVNKKSPWASSNVYAEVWGVDKVNCNVRPESRGEGRCAVLHTERISFKAAGMLTMNVVTAGSIYLGTTLEPIRDMNAAYNCVDMGIPFTQRPKNLVLDYAAFVGNTGKVIHATGRKVREYEGKDPGIIMVHLQQRWEKDGRVYAKRIATGEFLVRQSSDWRNQIRVPLVYGKPANEASLSEFSKLNSIFHTRNSEGKSVPIEEVGWAENTSDKGVQTPVTHLILFISSGTQGAYKGEEGNWLKIDNVGLEY